MIFFFSFAFYSLNPIIFYSDVCFCWATCMFLDFNTLVVSCLQVDKGISSEVVRSVLAERANLPCLAARSACKVSCFIYYC